MAVISTLPLGSSLMARLCGHLSGRDHGKQCETVVDTRRPRILQSRLSGSRGKGEKLLQSQTLLPTPRKSQQAQEAEVEIDRTTAVPEDLFMDFLKAGELARSRGQHQAVRSRSTGRISLVNMSEEKKLTYAAEKHA